MKLRFVIKKSRAKSGISLVEILVVIGILMVLAAIIFAALAPSRRQATHASCGQRMKQIYVAASLYAVDHHDNHFEELGSSITYVPAVRFRDTLSRYGATLNLWHCPETPSRALSLIGNTYTPTFIGDGEIWSIPQSNGVSDIPSARKANIKLRQEAGNDFPILRCTIHDELHHQPKEGVGGEPWLIWIRDDGSLKSGRVHWDRRVTLMKLLEL